VIFIDRSIPKGVAGALKQVRSDVKWLEDEFPHNVTDIDWLTDVGTRGWLVLTRDKKIRTRPGERQALITGQVGAFCFTQSDSPSRWDYLKLVCLKLDEMEQIFATTIRPFLYGVDRYGGLKRII
jgi:hypothetical protein